MEDVIVKLPLILLLLATSAVAAEDHGEMVYIPAGEFIMGAPNGEGDEDEHPRRKVYLDGFYIDKFEVTNGEYELLYPGIRGRMDMWSGADNEPVLKVTWEEARGYCAEVGKRLPTEAEWEKSARGTDGRRYPWGDDFVEGAANLGGRSDGFALTSPVGSFSRDVSPYGVMDMAGNAREWVSDRYKRGYYALGPDKNPKGPESGTDAVQRGGHWNSYPKDARVANRDKDWTKFLHETWGFRCAKSGVR